MTGVAIIYYYGDHGHSNKELCSSISDGKRFSFGFDAGEEESK